MDSQALRASDVTILAVDIGCVFTTFIYSLAHRFFPASPLIRSVVKRTCYRLLEMFYDRVLPKGNVLVPNSHTGVGL